MTSTAPRELVARKLPADDLAAVVAIRDWLLTTAVRAPDLLEMVTGLGQRLNAASVTVDRIVSTAGLLHSEYDAVSRRWEKGQGVETNHYRHAEAEADKSVYLRSPLYRALETRKWVVLDLASTPDDAFGIVPELKADGYTGYACAPIIYSNGSGNWISYATRAVGGFGERDLAMLASIEAAVAAVMEIRTAWRQLSEVLRIYVGDEPRREIMAGAIRRGQVSRIKAVLLVADMRDYTNQTADKSCEDVVAGLNAFFDCLVQPIETRGGEVLKYMGDGLLAIFREEGRSPEATAAAALAAAREALALMAEAEAGGKACLHLHGGVALHRGEAAYGNVGSGVRLDFTVIGPDVNLVSRIAGQNRPLGEPLLLSAAFAALIDGGVRPVGDVALKGFSGETAIFAPAQAGEA
jgi:adenylate cyclase